MLIKRKWLVLAVILAGMFLALGAGSSSGQAVKGRFGREAEQSRQRDARVERMKLQRQLPAMRQAAGLRFKQMMAHVIGQALAKAQREAVPVAKPDLGFLDNPFIAWTSGETGYGPRAEGTADPGQSASVLAQVIPPPVPNPGGIPHYFGPYANYANSPMPRGPVASLTLTLGGAGYVSPSAVILDAMNTGSGATATVAATAGVITGITLTSPGANYTAPVVYIVDTAGPGTGADAMAAIGPPFTGGMRKFVDALAGLNTAGANNLGQYIPVAIPDKTTYPGCDYYEIELGKYSEKLHSDLQPTLLEGYRQTNTTDPNVSKFHYLGPLIVAQQHVPVRIKFTNNLPTGAGGNLFVPVDTTLMGAGQTPNGTENYTQNRATIHLHGGDTPWISDGTPYTWTTPAGETTSYPHGVSVYNVPDMPDGGPNPPQGVLTYYYPNEGCARMMFYHDHAVGITRLNVYVGQAAGYVLTDAVESDLINGTNVTGVNPNNSVLLPGVGIPLVIQDKTFVDPATIVSQDPTWAWGSTPGTPVLGDLWMPHVYMPNQNPAFLNGSNPFGRWHYGPWFFPPTTGLVQGPIANPYYDPINAPWEYIQMPATPNPSMAQEAFMDAMMVNGTVYPYIDVEPKLYRFRILSVGNDRHLNLQMYVADPLVVTADGRSNTEVKMVPAAPTTGFPATWPTDGRPGGAPDPATAGPSWVQLGTEGGWLPAPVVIPNQPITYNPNVQAFNFGNVLNHSLALGPAERADVLVDFSAFAGKTLILYNDAPAAWPAGDPRYDIYTGLIDQTSTGGPPLVQPGFAPNTRTVMQIRVGTTLSGTVLPLNLTELTNVFHKTAAKPGIFESTQPPVIIPDARYNSAYNSVFAADPFIRIFEMSHTFLNVAGTSLTIPFENKAIHDEMGAAFDPVYGRMSAMLGLELGVVNGVAQVVLYPYGSPPVDIIKAEPVAGIPTAGDGTQIWKITHNGVDTHTLHFHAFDVQVINRVDWSNILALVDPNEMGWKETVRVSPLEDTFVALRAVAPKVPFDLPNSVRPIDLSQPLGAVLAGGPFGFQNPAGNPISVINHDVNWGAEYVFHCHLLGHEEMDMMHGQVIALPPRTPSGLVGVPGSGGTTMALTWLDNSLNETGFTVQRATDPAFTVGLVENTFGSNVTAWADSALDPTATYFWRVIATNTVGDTATAGFPVVTVSSTPSPAFGYGPGGAVTIAVTAPNGGEIWTSGTTHNVTWTQTGLTGTATIDLYKGGFLLRTLGTANVTAGTFSWAIAANEVAATDYRIRVSQGGMWDESNNNFSLIRPVLYADFNRDGQEDILWRNYGNDPNQGMNVVWLMNQNGAPILMALGSDKARRLATSASDMRRQFIIGGKPGIAQMPKSEPMRLEDSFKAILGGPNSLIQNPRGAKRDPRQGVRLISGQRPSMRDPVVGIRPGQAQIAAFVLNQQFILPTVQDTSWQIVGTGDFNGDLSSDILWRCTAAGPNQGTNVVWLMNGTIVSSTVLLPTVADTNWQIAGTGDFNGDRATDILWRNYGTGPNQGANVVWLMNGTTILNGVILDPVTDTTWQIVGTGDLNGDLQSDIIWRNYAAGPNQGVNVAWLMNGTAVSSATLLPTVTDPNWQIAGVGDFNKDLRADILWRFYGAGVNQGVNAIWYMNGAAIQTPEIFGAVTDLNWMIVNH